MIGIITALEKEYEAMNVMLDDEHEHVVPGEGAGRRYRVGKIPAASGGQHVVVVALSADMGNNASAIRTSQMLQHFPKMKHVIMTAIAGGVPNPEKVEDHVRLGDVVVSDRGGVVQYDLGKEEYDYAAIPPKPKFTPRFPPRPPSAELLEAVRLMRASELRGERMWLKNLKRAAGLPNSVRPAEDTDRLYDALDPDRLLKHPPDPQRVAGQPRVFLGIIGSSDRLQRNPVLRDELRKQFGVKAIEMEGAGVADAAWQLDRGYLVVRGICDYCDSHKNDVWQEYAAAVAAAYTRGLLASMPAEDRDRNPVKQVQLIIERNPNQFDSEALQTLQEVIAAILKVDKNLIRVLDVVSGSVKVRLELPLAAANQLVIFVGRGDFRLRSLNIVSIIIDDIHKVEFGKADFESLRSVVGFSDPSIRSARTVFDMRGQKVEKQINVNGNYYEIHGDGNVIGDHSHSTVTKTTATPLDPEVKRALAMIHHHLSQPDQRQTQDLLEAVHQLRDADAAALSEMRGMLDGVRRGLINLQTRELPAMDQRLRDAIAEVTEVVKANADVGTGLELTIPLIPLLLNYKVNLDVGGGLDLRQWWENLRERLQRGK